MSEKKSMGRRQFFKSSMAATGSLLLVKPQTAFGSKANSVLRLGIIGCGGRGNNVAGVFVEHTNTEVTALADIFDDRLESTRQHFDELQKKKERSAVSHVFKGSRAYLELVQSDVDVVLVTSPPYLHPDHLEAALNAGKHVYLEKPVATDVRGCKKVADLATRAQGKVSVDVGFQIRSAPHFLALTRRLQEGAVGEMACVQGFYFASDLPRKDRPEDSRAASKIRNWVFYRALGGDILVEQNVHIVDVFNWVLKAHPLRAEGTAARKIRTDIGDVSDHFVVTYHYPNDIRASFMSTQFLPKWGTVGWRFFGSEGFSEAFYSGGIRIVGSNPWESAGGEGAPDAKPEIDPLKDATPEKVKAFVDSIESRKFHNQLKEGSESSLSAILGRQAAYEGRDLTWDELLDSNQHWEIDLDLERL